MPLNGNSSHQTVIAKRRENVGRLRLRGLSQREIVEALFKLPADPVKVSLGTVNRDLQVIEGQWRDNAIRDIGEYQSQQLAEIAEAKRRCWQEGDLPTLARFLKLEADIRGTNAPAQVEVRDFRAEAISIGIPDDKIGDMLEAMITAAASVMLPALPLPVDPPLDAAAMAADMLVLPVDQAAPVDAPPE